MAQKNLPKPAFCGERFVMARLKGVSERGQFQHPYISSPQPLVFPYRSADGHVMHSKIGGEQRGGESVGLHTLRLCALRPYSGKPTNTTKATPNRNNARTISPWHLTATSRLASVLDEFLSRLRCNRRELSAKHIRPASIPQNAETESIVVSSAV